MTRIKKILMVIISILWVQAGYSNPPQNPNSEVDNLRKLLEWMPNGPEKKNHEFFIKSYEDLIKHNVETQGYDVNDVLNIPNILKVYLRILQGLYKELLGGKDVIVIQKHKQAIEKARNLVSGPNPTLQNYEDAQRAVLAINNYIFLLKDVEAQVALKTQEERASHQRATQVAQEIISTPQSSTEDYENAVALLNEMDKYFYVVNRARQLNISVPTWDPKIPFSKQGYEEAVKKVPNSYSMLSFRKFHGR